MKSSSQIAGLPVMIIEEGKEAGKVRSILLNPRQGCVAYFLVEDEDWALGLKALPFADVQAIGEFALTVASFSSLKHAAEVEEAVSLIKEPFSLSGLKVSTNKGRFLGFVSEYYLDEKTGKVAGCLLQRQGEEEPAGIIGADQILTYGKEYLIVSDQADSNLLSEIGSGEGEEPIDNGKSEEEQPAAVKQEQAGAKTTETAEAPAGKAEEGPLKAFREQQRSFLLGKRVTSAITGADGKIIAKEDEIVTEELIKKVEAANKFVTLTMNVK